MTKQARIGLLVGLAFIVMFGLVLTELVGTDASPPTTPAPASGNEESAATDVVTPVEDRAESPTRHAQHGDGRGLTQLSARRQARERARPQRRTQTAQRDEPSRRTYRARPSVKATRAVTSQQRTHRVQAGDNLRRIARRVYGAGHEHQYRRIYAANRDKLPDPDTLKIGQVLIIPPLDDAASNAASVTRRELSKGGVSMDLSGRSRKPSREPRRPQRPRTYRVRPDDTLTKIARRFLGSGSRAAVERLFQANRDKLTSPDELSVGAILTIPN
ncbi:MAG: LysM peptidoglycan-binding domain-containing protein [Phycisphaerae bacterium]|nr:LysM peptidoglycan-binding domain-containing protein [Phycisphaerae bacterium]